MCPIACGLTNSSTMPPATSRMPSRPLSTSPILKVLSSAGDSGFAGARAAASGRVICRLSPFGLRLPRAAAGWLWAFACLVDAFGEVLQPLGALLEPRLGRRGARGAEQVPRLDGAVPAAQPVQALFFLIELGKGELALGDLAGQLGLVLAAVGEELGPLGLPLASEQRLQ